MSKLLEEKRRFMTKYSFLGIFITILIYEIFVNYIIFPER